MTYRDDSVNSNSVSKAPAKTVEEFFTPRRTPSSIGGARTPAKTPAKQPSTSHFPPESYLTPVIESKKRLREFSLPDCTPKHRKTDIGPSSWFGPSDSLQYDFEEPATPEFVSPTRRRRFLVPRLDPNAFDQITSEMIGIEAPDHVMKLVPKSLILNKNCVEAAFDWLLDRWSTTEENPGLVGERLEQLYCTDQEELRKSSSFTEFEVDIDGELTVTRIVDIRK